MGKNIAELAEQLKEQKLSESEFNELNEWITNGYKNPQVSNLMESHWEKLGEAINNIDDEKINKIFSHILQQLKDEQKEGLRQVRVHKWYHFIQKVAAILILPLLATTIYLYFQKQLVIIKKVAEMGVMQTVEVAPGVRSHFYLPDSTEVWLNSQSRLNFSSNLANEQERRINLAGQAYFNVKHNKKQPFIVETNELNVKVLGTRFDLSAYQNDNFTTTTLEEGQVEVLNENGKSLLTLTPGQQSFLDINQQKIWAHQVETSLFTSWKDGFLIFRETPMPQVVKQLERWFNCEINLSDQLINSEFRYTATIHDEILDEVLRMIQLTTPINYTITNRNVTIW